MSPLFPALAAFLLPITAGQAAPPETKGTEARPNILVLISDDQSWLHTSASGDAVVRTPNFDRVAKDGVRFTHAFCNAPTCSASRAAMLTGRNCWELKAGANLWGTVPKEFATYPDILSENGYWVGKSGKGWGPGDEKAGGRTLNPAGPKFKNFEQFLKNRPKDAPFCFWFGSTNPHRSYELDSGIKAGKDPAKVVVPPYWPDDEAVRKDVLDYYEEVEAFDREVGTHLELLEKHGLVENTIVVITSDNGMPFPRGKMNLYDLGVRMPLAIRWPAKVPGHRVVEDLVSQIDLAPTFLEAAGVAVPSSISGKSLLSILESDKQGIVDPTRDHVYVGREIHLLWYPARALRTPDYLYIHNLRSEEEPLDCDAAPTLDQVKASAKGSPETAEAPYYTRCFGKRPEVELYDLKTDPDQIHNVAGDPKYAEVQAKLAADLAAYQKKTGDLWMEGKGELYSTFPRFRKAPNKEPAAKLSP